MATSVTVIVGAGIVGCLVARELAAADPAASITVLDRDTIGAGASRRSAGLHLPRGATARTRQMSALSHAYYADLLRQRPDIAIWPVAATVISGRAPDGRLGGGYLDEAAPAPAGGPRGSVTRQPESSAAWRIAGCHYADVYRLTQVLAAELRPRVRFGEGVAVTGLSPGADGVTVSVGTGEQITADSVVLAPGPWLSVPAWRDLVAPLGLRVKKIVALHIEQRPAPADEAVIFDDEDAFLLPLASRGHWLFSYASQEWDVHPDALTAGLSAADIGGARDCLRRHSPALAAACAGGRVFCDAYSPDREPAVRALDGAGRIVFAGAANGSGYRLGPAIAAEALGLLRPGSAGGMPSGRAQTTPAPRSEGATGDPEYV
jgi:glycine/D-amino acid oxidase-like deaminating enzyme